jgi:hypothetical protein
MKRRTGSIVLLTVERETLGDLRRVEEEVLLRIAAVKIIEETGNVSAVRRERETRRTYPRY